MSFDIRSVPIAGLVVLTCYGFMMADDWPAWRGPCQNGMSTEVRLPVKWTDPENLRWKTEVPGTGTSCPVIVGSSVLLTATSGRNHSQLHVLCFDKDKGQLQWDRKFFGTPRPVFTMFPPARGHAMPSVASNGSMIVALFSTGELFALDMQGRLRWTRSLAVDYGPFENDYGIAASPVISKDRVFLQVDRSENAYLLSVSLEDGETVWKRDRLEISDNWSTPVVTTIDSTPVIMCAGSKRLEAFDATSGAPLWMVEGLARLCCPTPILMDDSVIVTSGPGGNVRRLRLPLRLDGKPETLWQSVKGAGFVPSGICVGDLYYYGSDRGIVSCLDLKTGEELWQQRIGAAFRGSPVAADGHIYFTTLDGKVTVIKAARQYHEVAVNELGEQVSASPAIADQALFYRGEKHLICIGRKISPVAILPSSSTLIDRNPIPLTDTSFSVLSTEISPAKSPQTSR